MKHLGYIIALFLSCAAASAAVVKEPGDFSLDQNTIIRVAIWPVTIGGPFFQYQLLRKNSDEADLLTDPIFTATKTEEAMIFYWDDIRKVLWFGTRKQLASLSEADLKKEKHVTGHSTVWDTTGEWLHWDAGQMPTRDIPEAFLKQAKEAFRP